MKKIRRIQNVIIAVGMITVLVVGDGIAMTWKDFSICTVIIALIFSIIAYRVAVEQKEQDK